MCSICLSVYSSLPACLSTCPLVFKFESVSLLFCLLVGQSDNHQSKPSVCAENHHYKFKKKARLITIWTKNDKSICLDWNFIAFWSHDQYGNGLVMPEVVFELHTFEFWAHIEAQQIKLFVALFPSVTVSVQCQGATCGEGSWHTDYGTLHWKAVSDTQVGMEGNCRGKDWFCIQARLLHYYTVYISLYLFCVCNSLYFFSLRNIHVFIIE